MYCFFYLCHEEAAIIKVCVEVSQYRGGRGSKGGIDCVNIWGTVFVLSWIFFVWLFSAWHTHIHTLLRFLPLLSAWCSRWHCWKTKIWLKPEVKSQWQTCHIWKTFQFLIIIHKVETIPCLSLKGFCFCFCWIWTVDLFLHVRLVCHCACSRVVKLPVLHMWFAVRVSCVCPAQFVSSHTRSPSTRAWSFSLARSSRRRRLAGRRCSWKCWNGDQIFVFGRNSNRRYILCLWVNLSVENL